MLSRLLEENAENNKMEVMSNRTRPSAIVNFVEKGLQDSGSYRDISELIVGTNIF